MIASHNKKSSILILRDATQTKHQNNNDSNAIQSTLIMSFSCEQSDEIHHIIVQLKCGIDSTTLNSLLIYYRNGDP